MSRRRTAFGTRLFLALFLLSALPAAGLLGLATWGLRDYVQLSGGLDPWSRVSGTGRQLLETVDESEPDSALAAAARAHEAELSRSLRLARRFDLIASRLAGLLPWVALALGLILAALALWAARMLAVQLGRPLGEMVSWANRLARGEALPPPGPGEERGPREFLALRSAFRHMADRLAEGRRQAVEAERLRTWTEMARRVAHELKNPLTPLGFAIRQARTASERGDEAALADSLEVIAQETEHLDEIARSFAQLGRLPEGPKSEIDLEELLRSLLDSDLPSGIEGSIHGGDVPRVRGHLTALSRVFRNLLGNAVQALEGAPPGDGASGRIDVTMAASNGEVEIAIADNGPGIAPENRDRVWDPNFTTRKRGTGLGLALVRQTVRAHGGDVELRDTEGGACFVVRLPVEPDKLNEEQ